MQKLVSALLAASAVLMISPALFAQPHRRIVMPKTEVRGTPPAPQAVYVLVRARTGAEPNMLKKSFVPRIISSVKNITDGR